MKLTTLILAAIMPAYAAAQAPNFSISGKIGTLNAPAKIYIDYTDGESGRADSCVLVNGAFSFSGNNPNIYSARLTLDHTGEGKEASIYKGLDALYFHFADDHIVINSPDSLLDAKVTGSQIYNDEVAYNNAVGGTPMYIMKKANEKFLSATPEERNDPGFAKAVQVWYINKNNERTTKAKQFAINNPHSFFAVVALAQSVGAKIDPAAVEPVFNAIDEKWRLTGDGKGLALRIKAARTIVVGSDAPAFTLKDLNGKPVALVDLKGKIVLIDFWASWCEPCRAESPNLKTQYKLYKDKGFEIISVSLDKDKNSWLKAIKDDGLPWIQVSDLLVYSSPVVKNYGIGGIPAFFLINREGKVIGTTDLQGAALNQKLAELFKN